MKISAKNLMDSLSSELSPIYLLMAQETFQIQELVDKICTQAKKENFLERQSFYISKGTDWSFLKSSEERLIGLSSGFKLNLLHSLSTI